MCILLRDVSKCGKSAEEIETHEDKDGLYVILQPFRITGYNKELSGKPGTKQDIRCKFIEEIWLRKKSGMLASLDKRREN
jgi:hypothetical protein